MKLIFLLVMALFGEQVCASLLHDFVRMCDVENTELFLSMGAEHPSYQPQVRDVKTGQTAFEALDDCHDLVKKEKIRELLAHFSEIYAVKIPQDGANVYAKNISDRRFPLTVLNQQTSSGKNLALDVMQGSSSSLQGAAHDAKGTGHVLMRGLKEPSALGEGAPLMSGDIDQRPIFINDESILNLHLPIAAARTKKIVGTSTTAIEVNGRWVVAQKCSRSCGAAAVLMRQLDLGIEPSSSWFARTSATYSDKLMRELEHSKIDVELVSFFGSASQDRVMALPEYLHANIKIRGPAIVNGVNQEGGGHWFIVDNVQLLVAGDGFADIRDPWHGWSVRIKQKEFLKILGEGGDDQELVEIIWTSRKP